MISKSRPATFNPEADRGGIIYNMKVFFSHSPIISICHTPFFLYNSITDIFFGLT